MKKLIVPVDLLQVDPTCFVRRYVSCIVLTKDHKIMLQKRGTEWLSFPGMLSTFGGQIELKENPLQTLVRELKEELGADIEASEVISFGAYTEAITDHNELIYGYFWHDKQGTITGCYEGEAKYFDSIKAVFNYPNVMEDVRWLLKKCHPELSTVIPNVVRDH